MGPLLAPGRCGLPEMGAKTRLPYYFDGAGSGSTACCNRHGQPEASSDSFQRNQRPRSGDELLREIGGVGIVLVSMTMLYKRASTYPVQRHGSVSPPMSASALTNAGTKPGTRVGSNQVFSGEIRPLVTLRFGCERLDGTRTCGRLIEVSPELRGLQPYIG